MLLEMTNELIFRATVLRLGHIQGFLLNGDQMSS